MSEVIKITKVSDVLVSVIWGHSREMDSNTGGNVVIQKLLSNVEKTNKGRNKIKRYLKSRGCSGFKHSVAVTIPSVSALLYQVY